MAWLGPIEREQTWAADSSQPAQTRPGENPAVKSLAQADDNQAHQSHPSTSNRSEGIV